MLPSVAVGEPLKCVELNAKEHTTQPPGRYSEAALTKALEERGIGRPSTYASIIDTIQARNYVFKKGGALVPTWVAFSVVQLLEEHLAGLVDYQFTAQMEDDLDAISRGEQRAGRLPEDVLFRQRHAGAQAAAGEQDRRDRRPRHQPHPDRHARRAASRCIVRVGRYSPFVEQGERTASLPEETPPDEVTLEVGAEAARAGRARRRAAGHLPRNAQAGVSEGRPLRPVRAARHAGRRREAAECVAAQGHEAGGRRSGDGAEAADAAAQPGRPSAAEHKPVMAYNGRFGPYVKCGEETRSLPADISPLDVTLEQAVAPAGPAEDARPRRRRRRKSRSRCSTNRRSPSSKVQLLDGRYGPYVTDGETNASLPKGASVEELTFAEALELLAARAALGPPKKKRGAQSGEVSEGAEVRRAEKSRHEAPPREVGGGQIGEEEIGRIKP